MTTFLELEDGLVTDSVFAAVRLVDSPPIAELVLLQPTILLQTKTQEAIPII
jgi:hypothetical protein